MDLKNKVTVFLLSAGYNPSQKLCQEALDSQTCIFAVDEIKDISPMGAAFQEMLLRAQTPYFIQCDCDMVLQPGTIERMLESIESSPENNVMNVFMLRDVHLDRPIYGVKIYKTNIVKKYPYNLEHPSCEVEQLERLKNDGFTFQFYDQVVGDHAPKWSHEGIFERYYNLLQKYRIFGYHWMGELPRHLFDIFSQDASEENFYALAGMLWGVLDPDDMENEKNFKNHRIEFTRIRTLFSRPEIAKIYFTQKCNYQREWCLNIDKKKKLTPDLSPELLEVLLKKYPSIKKIIIGGSGEPFLSNYLNECLSVARKNSIETEIVTNGSLLSNKISDLVKAGFNGCVNVLLKGRPSEKSTNKNNWPLILSGINDCVKSNITCRLSFAVNKKNIESVPEVIKLANACGVKELHLNNLLPHFKHIEKFWELALDDSYKEVIEGFKNQNGSGVVSKWPVLISKNGGYGVCKHPWNTIVIDGAGSVGLCPYFDPSSQKHGNIREPRVFHNRYFNDFRNTCLYPKNTDACFSCFNNWLPE